MRRLLLAGTAALFLVAGCSSDGPGLVKDEPFPPEEDPNDPVICEGDPDTSLVCKKQSEFWDCTTMPNGDVKCAQPQTPDGTSTWTCREEGGSIICETTDENPSGGAGWDCNVDEFGTTVCEKSAPPPPPNGGSDWNCTYNDAEFAWECTGTPPAPTPDGGTTPPPPTDPPPGAMPPGGGTYDCYGPAGSSTIGLPPDGSWAQVVAKKVLFNGTPAMYVRVTFNKAFVDNTYGTNANAYTNRAGKTTGHSFGDLEESDKAEVFVNDAKGDLVKHFGVDYISSGASTKTGYGCLGVTGGDGYVVKGSASDILAARSSLQVNLNALPTCLPLDEILVNSPATDDSYTPNPQCPDWIYEVWYELWIKWDSFGAAGPGKPYITGIHASPSKIGDMMLEVIPVPCP